MEKGPGIPPVRQILTFSLVRKRIFSGYLKPQTSSSFWRKSSIWDTASFNQKIARQVFACVHARIWEGFTGGFGKVSLEEVKQQSKTFCLRMVNLLPLISRGACRSRWMSPIGTLCGEPAVMSLPISLFPHSFCSPPHQKGAAGWSPGSQQRSTHCNFLILLKCWQRLQQWWMSPRGTWFHFVSV